MHSKAGAWRLKARPLASTFHFQCRLATITRARGSHSSLPTSVALNERSLAVERSCGGVVWLRSRLWCSQRS
jgi:hypothetical protein